MAMRQQGEDYELRMWRTNGEDPNGFEFCMFVKDPVEALREASHQFTSDGYFEYVKAECWHQMSDGQQVRQWALTID
jgi:hypothetical protein